MADDLIALVEVNPQKIYALLFGASENGHACGFRKDEKTLEYHFLDSNGGWFKFGNVKDFRSWFIYFYKKKCYESDYAHKYKIDSFANEDKAVQLKL